MRLVVMFLLIRPLEGSQAMASFFEALGISTVVEPLLSYVPLDPPSLQGIKTVVVSSGYALKTMPVVPTALLFCVGERTAEKAKNLGFLKVFWAEDAGALLAMLKGYSAEALGPIQYVCGRHKTVDFEAALGPLGYAIRTHESYHMKAREAFSQKTLSLLREGSIHGVCVFSKRTAHGLRELFDREKIPPIRAFCLSEAVGDVLRRGGWHEVMASPSPTLNSFWTLFENGVE